MFQLLTNLLLDSQSSSSSRAKYWLVRVFRFLAMFRVRSSIYNCELFVSHRNKVSQSVTNRFALSMLQDIFLKAIVDTKRVVIKKFDIASLWAVKSYLENRTFRLSFILFCFLSFFLSFFGTLGWFYPASSLLTIPNVSNLISVEIPWLQRRKSSDSHRFSSAYA